MYYKLFKKSNLSTKIHIKNKISNIKGLFNLIIVFENSFIFFRTKKLENIFGNQKPILCFIFPKLENMIFSKNIF